MGGCDPEAFRRFCSKPVIPIFGKPVDVLRNLFVCFKTLHLSVFFGWCYLHGNGTLTLTGEDGLWIGVGGVLIAIGQLLNIGVFVQLGKIGVF